MKARGYTRLWGGGEPHTTTYGGTSRIVCAILLSSVLIIKEPSGSWYIEGSIFCRACVCAVCRSAICCIVAHSCPNCSSVMVKQIPSSRCHRLISSSVGHLHLGDSDAKLESRAYHSSILFERAARRSPEIDASLSTWHRMAGRTSISTKSSTAKCSSTISLSISLSHSRSLSISTINCTR